MLHSAALRNTKKRTIKPKGKLQFHFLTSQQPKKVINYMLAHQPSKKNQDQTAQG